MEGLDTLLLFFGITIAITLWQMFTDRTSAAPVRYNYHADQIYGK